MSFSKTVYYGITALPAGEMSRALGSTIQSTARYPKRVRFMLMQNLPDGTCETSEGLEADDLQSLCSLGDLTALWTQYEGTSGPIMFKLSACSSTVLKCDVTCVSASDASNLISIFTTSSGLSVAEDPWETQMKRLGAITAQLDRMKEETAAFQTPQSPESSHTAGTGTISDDGLGGKLGLTCFLSYRFDPANEVVALRVQRFLSLLGVEVVTGSTYEPRPVSQKVMERLTTVADFVVLLVTNRGESMWTRDEIAIARARQMPVVPLIEEGAAFSPGIFGDLEYISYSPDHIGDAFMGLLEAVNSIRLGRDASRALRPASRSAE